MSDGFGVDAVVALLIVTNLLLLGTGRLRSGVTIVALQGLVVGLLPLLLHAGDGAVRPWVLAGGSMLLKGAVFPWLLRRILRESGTRREAEPFVGYTLSVAIGIAAVIFAIWVGTRIALPGPLAADLSLVVPAGLATLLIGLFLTVSRRTALSQVIGYIVVENGIYTFGVALVGGVPLLVELGVLMDVFVAVFIMSIAAYHISREFDHIDVGQLDRLRG
jgi:hydrogenase-4 component E